MRLRAGLPGLLTPLLILAAWEGLIRGGVLDFDYLPAPSSIGSAAAGLAAGGELAERLLHTTGVTLLAWVLALAVALAAGTLLGLSHTAWRWSMASVEVLRTLPAVALVPVALLVLGPTTAAEIVVAVYAASWPLLISVVAGLQDTPQRLIDVARQMRLPRSRVVVSLMLPAAAPLILSGARLALGISLIVVVLAEMVGNPAGLGAAISETQMALQPEDMWVYVLSVAVLGTVLNAVLLAVSRRALPAVLAREAS
ncbi:ABC transporter permease [Actinocorallia longicatena]|uniref:ABC transmembrane type-1 domain-containing protein n=1 Tax=Actinocorallia longicatena TaxID=111803 RepID=A0ABP6QG28_9ACTN